MDFDFLSEYTPEERLPHAYHYADWKYEKIMEEIASYEKTLDDNTEVALNLACFGQNVLLNATEISYQNPDMLYFYGTVNGAFSQLIQHSSQLNFLITSCPKQNPSAPPRRIGFVADDTE